MRFGSCCCLHIRKIDDNYSRWRLPKSDLSRAGVVGMSRCPRFLSAASIPKSADADSRTSLAFTNVLERTSATLYAEGKVSVVGKDSCTSLRSSYLASYPFAPSIPVGRPISFGPDFPRIVHGLNLSVQGLS